MQVIADATLCVADASRAATMTLREISGLSNHELNEVLGAPALFQRIADLLTGEGLEAT